MSRLIASLVSCVAVVLVAACAPDGTGPGLDVARAQTFIDVLARDVGPRPVDTPASRSAAQRIADELARAGIAVERLPVGTVDIPGITVLGSTYRRARRTTVADPNLVARFGPPGPALLVMAHYDTVPGSPGAIDNAAAVAMLVELARVLDAEPPEQPVMLAFTAGEETGLVGAEALAAQLGGDVAFAIALDLIGGDGELVVNGASELVGAAELGWLASAADQAGIVLRVPPAHRVISRWWPQAERSDHGPFTRRGVRGVHFYHRGNDGEWIDLAYHSTRDVSARVQAASLDELGRLLRALVATPIPAYAGDGFSLPLAANVVIPRVALVFAEILLVVIALTSLVFSRTGLLAFVTRSRSHERGPGLLAGALCYAAAVAFAFALERVTSNGHPAPWLHAPLRMMVAHALVIGGGLGLLTRAVARLAPWRGTIRYLAVATLVPLAIGSMLLAIGAAELAWVWLVPAALLAVAPTLSKRLGLVAVPFTLVPVAAVLHPYQLREAAWNAFLPLSVPLAAWVGIVGIPVVATVAWALRRRPASGPLGTLALGLGCGLAVIAGLVVAITASPTCSAAEFQAFHLACERV